MKDTALINTNPATNHYIARFYNPVPQNNKNVTIVYMLTAHR